MASPPLIIILHGLIALVQSSGPDGTINEMTALLVDGRKPPALACITPHEPLLQIRTSQKQCTSAGCDKKDGVCTCRASALERKQILFKLVPALPTETIRLGRSPATELPPAQPAGNEAADIAYVARVEDAMPGMKLNSAALGSSPPPAVLSRMVFPFSQVSACSLAKREDGGSWYVHPLAYRRLGFAGTREEARQAMAQALVARVHLPETAVGTPQVDLVLRDIVSGREDSMTLEPVRDGYLVRLSNEGPHLDRDHPCDDGVARHFAFFFDLGLSPPEWANRPIPYIKNTLSVSAEHLTPSECDILYENFTVMERPVCPIAMFDPLN